MYLNPKVGIILINWNSSSKTVECIDSLYKNKFLNFKLIVIDNSSTDGSFQLVKSKYPNLYFIENHRNLGFSKACNQGIDLILKSEIEYTLLLNNDMLVDSSFLINLLSYADKSIDGSIFGSLILFQKNHNIINSFGLHMNLFGFVWDRFFGEYINNVQLITEKVLAVSGGAMLIKSEIFNKIGKLDEDYFAYYEDLEFCLRMRRLLGKEIYIVSNSICYHEFSGSSKNVPFFRYWLSVKNYWINLAKTFSGKMIRDYLLLIIISRLTRQVRVLIIQFKFKYLFLEIISFPVLIFYLILNFKNYLNKNFDKNYYSLILNEKKPPTIHPINFNE